MFFSRLAYILLLVVTGSLCEGEVATNTSTTEEPAPPPTTTPLPPTTSTTPASTVPPTSTTSAPPTPTPAPVDKSEWVVTGINGTVCILAKMNISLRVPYTTLPPDNQTVVKLFDLSPFNTDSTGNCSYDNSSQTLTVLGENITVMFVFSENSTEKNYDLHMVSVTLIVNNYTLPNTTWKENLTLVHTRPEFTTPTKMSYTCVKPDPMVLNSSQTTEVTMTLSNVHFEAFGAKKEKSFNEAMDCNTFETPDVVPIAVGCALAALVIVVLISYLVGRRRSQARGYLSM